MLTALHELAASRLRLQPGIVLQGALCLFQVGAKEAPLHRLPDYVQEVVELTILPHARMGPHSQQATGMVQTALSAAMDSTAAQDAPAAAISAVASASGPTARPWVPAGRRAASLLAAQPASGAAQVQAQAPSVAKRMKGVPLSLGSNQRQASSQDPAQASVGPSQEQQAQPGHAGDGAATGRMTAPWTWSQTKASRAVAASGNMEAGLFSAGRHSPTSQPASMNPAAAAQ